MKFLIDNNPDGQAGFGPGPLPGNITIKTGQWKMGRCGSTTVPHKYACKKRYDVDPVLCRDGYVEGKWAHYSFYKSPYQMCNPFYR